MKKNDEKKFYGMMNDHMFHLVLQESQKVLKGLVSALIDIPLKDIKDCHIENPIDHGKTVDDKEIVLDVLLILNDDTVINVEVQVRDTKHWPERSLYYWTRAFDRLDRGGQYEELKKTYQIGILGYTLFPEEPEFYASYRILNERTEKLYTDKFCIRTLDITRTDLADDSPREQELLKWARIFKAKTLPELEAVIADKEVCREMTDTTGKPERDEAVLNELVETLMRLNADKEVRMRCEARERYYWELRSERREGYEEAEEKWRPRAEAAEARAAEEAARAEAADARAEAAEARAKIAERLLEEFEKKNGQK